MSGRAGLQAGVKVPSSIPGVSAIYDDRYACTSDLYLKRGPEGPHYLHIEQTQPRHAILLQQPLVNVLLVQLLDLRRGHLAAIGRKIAIGLRAHLVQSLIRQSWPATPRTASLPPPSAAARGLPCRSPHSATATPPASAASLRFRAPTLVRRVRQLQALKFVRIARQVLRNRGLVQSGVARLLVGRAHGRFLQLLGRAPAPPARRMPVHSPCASCADAAPISRRSCRCRAAPPPAECPHPSTSPSAPNRAATGSAACRGAAGSAPRFR